VQLRCYLYTSRAKNRHHGDTLTEIYWTTSPQKETEALWWYQPEYYIQFLFSITPEIAELCFFTLISGGTQTTQTFTKTRQWTLVPWELANTVDAKSGQTRFGRRNQESARYHRTYHLFHNLLHILQQENLCLKDGQSRMVNWEMESRWSHQRALGEPAPTLVGAKKICVKFYIYTTLFFLFKYHKIAFRCFFFHHIVMRSTWKPPYLDTGSLEVAKT
jgi:hypothetical protein